MWDDLVEFVFQILLMLAIIFATMGGVVYFCESSSCTGFGRTTGYEVRYDWACYVKVDDKWMPKQYVFGDAHEVRMKNK